MGRKKHEIIFVCENCGKLQKPDESKSNSNWNVFDCHERCECGGKYIMKIKE